MNTKEYRIKSLSGYIELIEEEVSDRYRITLFRGQNTDRALIPKIARKYFTKGREIDEQRMFEEFKSSAIQHLNFIPKNDLEYLTIAQHHGLPTRLLDWTENALAALFFATKYPSKQDDNAVVWFMSINRDSNILIKEHPRDLFSMNYLKFFKPSSIISRVNSQHGWFSLHPCISTSFYQRADIDYKTDDIILNKIILENGVSKSIVKNLKTCGINDYSIFQDLDSLSKYIFGRFKSEYYDQD